MELEIKVGERLAKVELVKREDDRLSVLVDKKPYEVDIVKVSEGIYSLLYKNHSYNVEIIDSGNYKSFIVNTFYRTFEVGIVDAEMRYLAAREKATGFDKGNVISSPMPGRIVKILVKQGESVEAGTNLIIVSAMKMESEYKASKSSVIKEILVNEGDIVTGHQPLIILE